MSKYLKNLITDDIKRRLAGVNDALLLNVIGLDSLHTSNLRKRLREKNIHLLVVKGSMARRATEGSALAAGFAKCEGSLAVAWGAEDIVSLAKEVLKVAEEKGYEKLESKGGVLDGQHLTPEQVKGVSKWPSRQEQLSLLVGQILGPGATLGAQLLGPGGTLAGQIKSKAEGDKEESKEPAAEATAG